MTSEATETRTPLAVTVARNASMLAAATLLGRVAMFVLAVVIGRELGPTQYGYYGLAVALGLVLVPLADAGLTPYVIRQTARDRGATEGALRRMFGVKLGLSGVTLAAAAVFAGLLSSNATLFAAVVLYVLCSLLDGVAQLGFGYFQGRERMGFEARVTAAVSLVRSTGAIALTLATARLIPAIAWMLVVGAVQCVYVLGRVRGSLLPATVRFAVHRGTVVTMGAITILTMLYTRQDSVLVAVIRNERQLGLYTAATTIMLASQLAPWMVGVALGPVFARSWSSDRGVFERSWQEGLRATMLIALPIALVISLLARPIMVALFGTAFAAGAPTLAILVWCTPLAAFNVLVFGVLRGAGREHALALIAAGGVAFNVVANLWAITSFGIAGAAATTIATEVVVCALLAAVAIRNGVVSAPRLPYLGLLGALGALALAQLATASLPPLVTAVAALAAYAGVALLARVMCRADLRVLREMLATR